MKIFSPKCTLIELIKASRKELQFPTLISTSIQTYAREIVEFASDAIETADSEKLLGLFEAYLVLNGFVPYSMWTTESISNNRIHVINLDKGENRMLPLSATAIFVEKRLDFRNFQSPFLTQLRSKGHILAFPAENIKPKTHPSATLTLISKKDLGMLISSAIFADFLDDQPMIVNTMREKIAAIIQKDIRTSLDDFSTVQNRLPLMFEGCSK